MLENIKQSRRKHAVCAIAVLLIAGTVGCRKPSEQETDLETVLTKVPKSEEDRNMNETEQNQIDKEEKQQPTKEADEKEPPIEETPECLKDHSFRAKEFQNITDPVQLAARNKERVLHMAKQYYQDFYVPEKGFLKLFYPPTEIPKTKPRDEPATCWEYGALMSMQSQLAILSPDEIERLKEVNENLDYYGYLKEGKLWGYVVHRGSTKFGATDPGLAYDDLEWLVINFLRSYEVTKESAYLEKAEYLMNFVLEDAWFEPLGGLFWDTRHEARHSCSNNPAIKPLVDLYLHTGKERYLDWAKRIFEFSLTLKNPELNIYEDLVRAEQKEDGSWAEGVPGGGYYTYNTGTMISGGAALYGVTKEQRYLDEALAAAKGAYEYFSRPIADQVTYWPCTSNIWFNCILLRGYLDLYPYAPEEAAFYINTFQNTMDFAYENYYYEGYLPINWIRGWGVMDRDKELKKDSLDHTANIEMYAMLANWQAERALEKQAE